MIIRMWHGRVHHDNARAYREFLTQRAIPDYQSIEGNVNVKILERHDEDATHFITMTAWDSLDSIRAFAGEDAEKAKYYPEDDKFLLEFEPSVVHYEVVAEGNIP